jgi:hypothetical protein
MNATAESRLMVWPINVLLAMHFALAMGFDYMGDQFKIMLAGVITLGYAALGIVAAFRRTRVVEGALLACIILIIITWCIGYAVNPGEWTNSEVSASAAFRDLAPYLAAVAIIGFRNEVSPLLLIVGCAAILIDAVISAILLPHEFLDYTYRWASFSAGLHTSSYTISLAGLVILEMSRQRLLGRNFALVLVATSLIMLAGYGVRTVAVLVIAFYFVDYPIQLLHRTRHGPMKIFFTYLVVGTAGFIALGTFVNMLSFHQLSEITSGRLANYTERFGDLYNRDISQLLFGTGPGSDNVITQVWWWVKKDAHNDFIHMVWEDGLFGFILKVAFLILLVRPRPWDLIGPLAAIVASSAGSNALLVRPNAAFLMFCLMALRIAYPVRLRRPGQAAPVYENFVVASVQARARARLASQRRAAQ